MNNDKIKIPLIVATQVLRANYDLSKPFPNSKLYDFCEKEFSNYEHLILESVMDGLDNEIAVLFFLNVLDFNYFYENKIYKTLNIDYPLVIDYLYYKSYFLKDIKIYDFIDKSMEILSELNLEVKETTNFILRLSNFLPDKNLPNDSREYILNTISKYDIKYNKFILSIYLCQDSVIFDDFDDIADELTLDWNKERVNIYATLFNNFERSLNASPSQLNKLLTDIGLFIHQPSNLFDKEIQFKYIEYLGQIFHNKESNSDILMSDVYAQYFIKIPRIFKNNIFYNILKFDLSPVEKKTLIHVYRLFCINTPLCFEKQLNSTLFKGIKLSNIKLYIELKKIRREYKNSLVPIESVGI